MRLRGSSSWMNNTTSCWRIGGITWDQGRRYQFLSTMCLTKHFSQSQLHGSNTYNWGVTLVRYFNAYFAFHLSPPTLTDAWRWARLEEKGAGGFLQDDWVVRVQKHKFSSQTLQVCALPRCCQHIKNSHCDSPQDLLATVRTNTQSLTQSPTHLQVSYMPAASVLIGFSCNGRKQIPPLSFFLLF